MRPTGKYQPGATVMRIVPSSYSPIGYKTTLICAEPRGQLRIIHANGQQDMFFKEYWELVEETKRRSGFSKFIQSIET